MNGGRVRGGRLVVGLAVVCGLMAGAAPGVAALPTADEGRDDDIPGWVEDIGALETGSGEDGRLSPTMPAPAAEGVTEWSPEPFPAPEDVHIPAPGMWDVTLGDEFDATESVPAEIATDERAGAERGATAPPPVQLAAAEDGSRARPGAGVTLQVEVLDADSAAAVGASGFAFSVTAADGAGFAASTDPSEGGVPVEMAIDYSAFADRYGADFADRLGVVALPRCAVEVPRPADCRPAVRVLPVTNDPAGERLLVDATDVAELEHVLSTDAPDDLIDVADAISEGLPPAGTDSSLAVEAAETGGSGDTSGPALDTSSITTSTESPSTPPTSAPDAGDVTAEAEPEGDDGPSADDEPGEHPASEGDAAPSTDAEAEHGESTPSTTSTTSSTAPSGGESEQSARPEADGTDLEVAAESLAAGGVVLAVTSTGSGENSGFTATDLSAAGDWQVAPGSGEFSYVWPIPSPAPPMGAAPDLGLGYSSGAVDGLVSTRNTQAPQNGVGWGDFATNFIERRYETCSEANPVEIPAGDLCWRGWNATISLNGTASRLVPTNAARTEWVLHNNPGWKVERRTGANNGDEGTPGVDVGEYWVVTIPDGTQYWFGRGSNPDTGEATNSAWTVPVFADNSGEPCRNGNQADACMQAWRWNLDFVVAPDNMSTAYFYAAERNRYMPLNGLGGALSSAYVRSGMLSRIDYGMPRGMAPAARVHFDSFFRCQTLNSQCTTAPRRFNNPNQSVFPDVPTDLRCSFVQGEQDCLVFSPTFFSASRYHAVRTEVRVGSGWKPVDRFDLGHAYETNAGGHVDMHLHRLRRVGFSGLASFQDTAVADPMPWVEFDYTEFANRVDVGGSKTAMGRHRITEVNDEFGAKTTVTYERPNPCSSSYNGPWNTNARDCFPQKLGSKTGVFNKWLVTQVTEVDTLTGATPMTTGYAYQGSPAWHFDDDPWYPVADQSWSDWRGYGTTEVTQGISRTKIRVFRGMDGDLRTRGSTPTYRDVDVDTMLPEGVPGERSWPDLNWLAGATLETVELGPIGEIHEGTRHEYQVRITGGGGWNPADWPAWVGETATTDYRPTSASTFRQRHTTTSYDTSLPLPLPVEVTETGWLDTNGNPDDNTLVRCTATTYAQDMAAHMFVYPASNTVYDGDCDTGDVVSASQTYYDGQTVLGALGSGVDRRALPTEQRVQVDESTWMTTAETTFDGFGRVRTVTDAAGGESTTIWEGTPNGGFPTFSQTTDAAGHATLTHWQPQRSVPTLVEDPNGKVTTYDYDVHGRLWGVKLPTEQGTPRWSWQFAYGIDDAKTAPPVVRSRQLTAAELTGDPQSWYTDAWLVYDSFGRERQSHSLSPEAGKTIVSHTTYDGRGLVRDQTHPQAVEGDPGVGMLTAQWKNLARSYYDLLGRSTRTEYLLDGALQGSWTTRTDYVHDQGSGRFATVVTPPEGGRTRTFTDAFGRTVQVDEEDTRGTAPSQWPAGETQSTSYTYDGADNLATVTDPAGNTISYGYNMAGWQLTMHEPDAGDWSYGFDDAGRMTSVTRPGGEKVVMAYDVLGRPTERREDSSSGTLLASWDYDAPGEAGLLNWAKRHTPEGEWTTDIDGYDDRGRPTGETVTVPAGIPGLSGTYQSAVTYDRADRAIAVSYPAVGGLPQETVETSYDSLGLARSMSGAADYVYAVAYDDRARTVATGFGDGASPNALVRWSSYDEHQQHVAQLTSTGPWGSLHTVANVSWSLDKGGNITDRTITGLGAMSWRECFELDTRSRLTRAYTTAPSGDACDTDDAGTGDRPYDHGYTYSPDGNMTSRSQDGDVVDYTYPDPGEARPHAPTDVGGDTYSWNPDGSLDERVVDGETETFDWDVEGQLASVAGPDGTDSYTYGPDGGRVLRETPEGRTLYVAGHEVTASLDGTEVDAVRTYSFDGAAVATRSSSGEVDYLVTDNQGSVIASVPAGAADADKTMAYAPYGAQRDATGKPATDRSWIGQIHDSSTDLAYLNARYYDPSAAVFISPDPKWDGRPRTHNPYSYGMNNPVTHSDPTGLDPPWHWDNNKRNDPPIHFQLSYANTKTGRILQAQGRATAAAHGISREAATRLHYQAWQDKQKLRAFAVRQRNAATLNAMRRANSSPAFWRALGAAGNAGALTLHAMHAANPDPGFWRAVNSLGSACSRDRGSTCTSGQVASYGRQVAAEAATRQRTIRRSNNIAADLAELPADRVSFGGVSRSRLADTGWDYIPIGACIPVRMLSECWGVAFQERTYKYHVRATMYVRFNAGDHEVREVRGVLTETYSRHVYFHVATGAGGTAGEDYHGGASLIDAVFLPTFVGPTTEVYGDMVRGGFEYWRISG